MDINNLKFKNTDFNGQDVASLPDKPSEEGISTSELKARFDNVGKVMVALGKHNELIDALKSGDGAANVGATAVKAGGAQTVQGILQQQQQEMTEHAARKNNPHAVSKAQVGLGSADNTADADKPVSKAQQAALDAKFDKTDIVQLRGRSETQVMSQKAVTDAIDAGGGGGTGGGEFEPVGCMKFFAGETLPSGYLWCDGASYPANGDYAKLYELIGERYNQPGDDVGTFRVPDFRGRVAVGKDAGTFDIVGKTGGEERQYISRDQLPNVNINVENNDSVHESIKLGSESATGTLLGISVHRKAGATWTNATVRLNGGQPQKPLSNLQPYLVCNYIIKYSKSYEEIGVTAPPCVWEFTAGEWQERPGGGYALSIPESEHRRGKYCVLTALYDTGEAGKLKAVLFEMEKDEAGNITIYSDAAFSGTAYIDRVYMVPAGRILTVNGQGPDMDGNVEVWFDVSDHVIYVAPSGDDTTGDGSEGHPFAGVQKAFDSIPMHWCGTVTVDVAAGAYYGDINLSTKKQCKEIRIQGHTAGNAVRTDLIGYAFIYCGVPVQLVDCWVYPVGAAEKPMILVGVDQTFSFVGSDVANETAAVLGTPTGTAASTKAGIQTYGRAKLYVSGAVFYRNYYAVSTTGTATILNCNIKAGNTVGLLVSSGGMAIANGNTNNAGTGISQTSGGMIAVDGTWK